MTKIDVLLIHLGWFDLPFAAAKPVQVGECFRLDQGRSHAERCFSVEMPLVGRTPIGCNVTLRRGKVEFTGANHFVKVFFQRILEVSIPGAVRRRLAPVWTEYGRERTSFRLQRARCGCKRQAGSRIRGLVHSLVRGDFAYASICIFPLLAFCSRFSGTL